MQKVKVKVTDDPNGHHHEGREVEPGEVLEVWERQAAFLEERGIAVPYSAKTKSKKSRRRKSAKQDDASDEESVSESPDEGADETPDQ